VGATLIAWLLPAIREIPSLQTLLGGMFILGGIALGTLGFQSRPGEGEGDDDGDENGGRGAGVHGDGSPTDPGVDAG
jgi:hypothetical protein